jgi:hypothetical protein
MTIFLESNYLDMYNILNAKYLEKQSTKPKILQDGKLLIASGENDSITIYPRKNAVTVWGHNPNTKILFAFNITYLTLKTATKTKVLQNVYNEIVKHSGNSSRFEVGLIMGYRGESKNTVNTIENWIDKNNLFQKSQESFSLCKGLFSVMDSNTGKRNEYHGMEPKFTKFFRLTKKHSSILLNQESSIKISY